MGLFGRRRELDRIQEEADELAADRAERQRIDNDDRLQQKAERLRRRLHRAAAHLDDDGNVRSD